MKKELKDKNNKTYLIRDEELELIEYYNMHDDMPPKRHMKVHKLLNYLYLDEFISEIMGDLNLPPERITLLQIIKWAKTKESSTMYDNRHIRHFPCYKCAEELRSGKRLKDLSHIKAGKCLNVLYWDF